MEVRHIRFQASESPIHLALEHAAAPGSGTLIGTAQMQAGQRIPAQGESVHPADEYSYILRGRVTVEISGQAQEYGPGTLMLIPAGEGHITTALDDAEVLWWWVGQPQDFGTLKTQYGPPQEAPA